MLITRDQQIAGLSAVDARALMRAIRDYSVTVGAVAELMNISTQEADDLIERLATAGLVCRVDRTQRSDCQYLEVEAASFREAEALDYWGTTLAGNALSKARIGKPMHRSKAEKLLEGLLDRVEAVNADPDGLFSVEKVEIFGSFADPTREMVGDVDAHVLFDRRVEGDEFIRRALDAADRAEDSGRSFNSHIDRLSFAELDFYRRLRNGSSRLDIQFDAVGHEDPLPPGATTQVVYERIPATGR